ncbi:uncharacterized protein K460DRAFT_76725 [Cucurbitaria berberidis CBS 394.84]|uniref:Uncharacterized protein n=1 Tax=Cucurbitaria berberidis CBS 394.84 TaxID=1168544 RepID=A0A9P4LBH8_9PLEO|nr:uncharacterized protein K460DRAFT_76725 [Cucurbitaria berberidis CBS 394.84]KAF1848543.1 hypothetical protein K460DRAFT_76725 [Cucurbitaria berberidis CBS 394.84]
MRRWPEKQKSLLWAQNSRPRRQTKISIPYDVLDKVVYHVFVGHRGDLLKLCRVCIVAYFACIPWIYRIITIDFSDHLGRVLLQRLSKVYSNLPVFVRTIALKSCDQATTAEWRLLDKTLAQVTRLQELSWDDYAALPEFVLDSIHFHHPKSRIRTRVTQMFAGQIASTSRLPPTRYFFTSPVLEHLTSFDFSAQSNALLYDDFKGDLVDLLKSAPNLGVLRIYRGPVENDGRKFFPELLSRFRTPRLPQLEVLYLTIRSVIFTRMELNAWGVQDGWSKLQYLMLSRATDLIPFISRVPRLTYLNILADKGEGMEELTEHLEPCTGAPLGRVRTLVYNHFMDADDQSNARIMHALPWSILDKTARTLTKYTSWHQPYEVFWPGFAMPNLFDLGLFPGKSPALTDLTLDICVLYNLWPREVLRQLAAFQNVRRLRLYVHQPMQPGLDNFLVDMLHQNGWHPAEDLDFRGAFQIIIAAQAKPSHKQKLLVEFKLVRDYKNMESHIHDPDWRLYMTKTGHIVISRRNTRQEPEPNISPRKKYANLSSRELKNRQQTLRSLIDIGHRVQNSREMKKLDDDWVDIIIEITRRNKIAILEKKYGDATFTLYDKWTAKNKIYPYVGSLPATHSVLACLFRSVSV